MTTIEKRTEWTSYHRKDRIRDGGRRHVSLGNRLINQGKIEQGIREYSRALRFILRQA